MNAIIVISWFLLPVMALLFLIRFGRPGKYMDPEMAWHLWVSTALLGGEAVALLVANLSLIPAAFIYVGSVGLMGWRLWLLHQSLRRQKKLLSDQPATAQEGESSE